MGVKNLSKIFQKYCPQSIKRSNLDSYKGKTIGIDASIFFYRFMYVSNKYNKPNHYLQLFYQQIMGMIAKDITPIYIFDGKPPAAKDNEKKKRSDAKISTREKVNREKEYVEQLKKTLKGMSVNDEYRRLMYEIRTKEFKIKTKEDGIINVTEKHKSNLKALLTILAIPFVQGYGETDPLSSQLCKDGLVDCILSDDMDYVPLACPSFIRTERTPKGSGADYERVILEYKHSDILQGLGMTSLQFIDLCILCGCDYVDQLYKIGPITAFKLIKDHQSIENALGYIDHIKHKVPGNYMELVKEARACFQKTHTHRITKKMLNIKQPDIPKLKNFMKRFCDFSSKNQEYYLHVLFKSPIVPIKQDFFN